VFAKVTNFRPNHTESAKGFGFAKTAEGKDFYLPMWACRKVFAGPTAPDFSFEEWQQWPHFNDEIVVLPDIHSPRNGEAHRAWRWGYRRYWDLALNQIKDRPMYRVVGENRFKGQVMKNDIREEEVTVGTMEELQSKFPRGVANDPLGTEQPYRSGPCQRLNRWQIWKNAEFVNCDDPRPNPNLVSVTTCERELKPEAAAHSVAEQLTELDRELAAEEPEKFPGESDKAYKFRLKRMARHAEPVAA
jgi:hypothetical protein